MRRIWTAAIGVSMLLCVPSLWAATKTTSGTASTATAARHQTGQRWAPQDLKGTISMVDPKMDLVVVRDSNGVPFDIKVAHTTKIDSGNQREELAQLTPKESVSVHYVPEARGDVARSIQVQR